MYCPILLCDANSFFASCHIALSPGLADQPLVVGGDPKRRHGIVLAANYIAKLEYGIKTGMGVWEARERLGGRGVFVVPQHHIYIDFSLRVLRVARRFTDRIEPFSIDEFWADVSNTRAIHKTDSSEEIARRLQREILEETGIPTSIGVSANKLLAKQAAGMKKPLGITVLDPREVPERLWPLPVRELFGVGPRLEKHLRVLNIHTIGDLANYPENILKKRFGLIGLVLRNSANGLDYSPLDPLSLEEVKSIGHQLTLPRDYRGYGDIQAVVLELSDIVGRRVRVGGYAGKTVGLTLKDPEFKWLHRTQSLPWYTDFSESIYETAVRLLHRHWPEWKPVRMVGVTLSNLVKRNFEQMDLFGRTEKQRRLVAAVDGIKDRFGEQSILKGVSLTGAGVVFADRWGDAGGESS